MGMVDYKKMHDDLRDSLLSDIVEIATELNSLPHLEGVVVNTLNETTEPLAQKVVIREIYDESWEFDGRVDGKGDLLPYNLYELTTDSLIEIYEALFVVYSNQP
jgi:hypothetical protein